MEKLKGIGVSSGIAIARVVLLMQEELHIDRVFVDENELEVNRFKQALSISKKQLEAIKDKAAKEIGKKEAEIFSAHLMILADPEYVGKIAEKVRIESINADYAIKEITDEFIQIFKAMDNDYMQERAVDITDVSRRIINNLQGRADNNLVNLQGAAIIVAKDLSPSETAQLDKEQVVGFITEIGGKTSHSAIMARTLKIPAVVGVSGATAKLNNNDLVIIDGEAGIVLINPEDIVIEEYNIKQNELRLLNQQLTKLIGQASLTKDGKRIELAANIGVPADVKGVITNDGEGVGLFRTEFLYMNRESLPTEEEQFDAYKSVAEQLKGKPVIIRTLDVGGDKDLPYLKLPKELNPFLGYRAIRLCLDQQEIFKPQLRAILRASYYGNIKIMFPMISSIEELRATKELLNTVKLELQEEKQPFAEYLEVGMMVEIPSVAVMADIFAKEVDFFSIGTNDLIQYTTAVDRMNPRIAELYTQYHPAVLRLIKGVIDAGHNSGIWVGMCGEAASDPKLIPLFIGMGLDEFSMSSSEILQARWIISQTSQQEIQNKIEKILSLPTANAVEKYLGENIKI